MAIYTTKEMDDTRRSLLEERVARYKFISSQYLASLSNEKLWISDPKNFNDPFDLKIIIENRTLASPFGNEERLRKAFSEVFLNNDSIKNHWFYDDELIESLTNWIKGPEHYSWVIDQFKRRVSLFGVSCFAQDWNVPLMWSHYGESHRGICIEYAVHPMKIAFDFANQNLDQYHVRYATELPMLCLSELLFSPHQVLPNFLATKHADWAYEKEWRLVNYTTKNSFMPMPSAIQISAIIIGLHFDMSRIKEITTKAAELGVPVYMMRRRFGYELNLVPW